MARDDGVALGLGDIEHRFPRLLAQVVGFDQEPSVDQLPDEVLAELGEALLVALSLGLVRDRAILGGERVARLRDLEAVDESPRGPTLEGGAGESVVDPVGDEDAAYAKALEP